MIAIQSISIIRDRRKYGKFSCNEFKQCTPEYGPEKRRHEGNLRQVEQVFRARRRCDHGKADLVSQVVTKYGLPQIQAQSEVDALLKGRQVGAGA